MIIINRIRILINKIFNVINIIMLHCYENNCYYLAIKNVINSSSNYVKYAMENITVNIDKLSEEIKLLRATIAQLTENNSQLTEKSTALAQKNAQLEISLENALEKINWFEEQYKKMRNSQFGKSSEKLSAMQQEIIFNADDTLATQAQTANETTSEIAANTETITYTRRKKNGRNIDTSKLPRVQRIHDLSAEQKICSGCGNELHKIRDDKSEQIEIIPHQMYVVEHICPQYACSQCETITAGEKEQSPIPKSMAGASLISDVIISKYEHHLPLYRQSKILKGLGVDIPDNTLGHWVMQTGDGLSPIDAALQDEIIESKYLQVDETPVKLLEPEKTAFMWVFLNPLAEHKLIRFKFDLTRSGNVVNEQLKKFKGLLQNDGYSGYNAMRAQSTIIAFGCCAHARRKFAEVVKTGSKKSLGKAGEALEYFAKLYLIEEKARQDKMNYEQRKILRQTESIPILDKFNQWLIETYKFVPPESGIGKAIDYTIKQWLYLIRYCEHGEVEIDTNLVENQIRPFAIGKKNWLFIMHEEGGRIAALYYSLIQSAKLNGLNPRVYMHYLLTQIHALRKKIVNPVELLPHRINPDVLNQFAENEFKKAQSIYDYAKNSAIS
jgi:transposase